jgi:hypothetical protein
MPYLLSRVANLLPRAVVVARGTMLLQHSMPKYHFWSKEGSQLVAKVAQVNICLEGEESGAVGKAKAPLARVKRVSTARGAHDKFRPDSRFWSGAEKTLCFNRFETCSQYLQRFEYNGAVKDLVQAFDVTGRLSSSTGYNPHRHIPPKLAL